MTMHRFLGNMEAKLDGKGRVFVPASYRRSLEGAGESTLFLRLDAVSRCLKLYPSSEWERQNAEFSARLNLWNRDDLRLYRQFTACVEPVDLDASGRVLLQKKYLEVLGVSSEVLFVGVGGYFEIWNKATFDEDLFDDAEFMAALQEKMGNNLKF